MKKSLPGYYERFARTELLLGRKKLDLLKRANVTVCGLGAVGSYVVEALARAGIGTLRLVDFDIVRSTNFNRQLYALTSNLGKFKADIAKDRVKEINPDCEVIVFKEFVHHDTFDKIFKDPTDVVVDAIDSVSPKVFLLAECHRRGMTVIASMGAGGKRDPESIQSADLFKTKNCRLAQQVRKRLKKMGISSGIRSVFSTELIQESSVAVEEEEPESYQRGRIRQPIGSLSYMTGIFGLRIAHEVCHYLLNKEEIRPLTKERISKDLGLGN